MAITLAERARYEQLTAKVETCRVRVATLIEANPKMSDTSADHSEKAHNMRWAIINAAADQWEMARREADAYAHAIYVREGIVRYPN